MLVYSVLHVIVYLFIIQFSFSDFFGNNVYIFIGLMKIVGMATGEIGENMLEDRLLMVPVLMMHEIMEGLITFGAADFLSFLISYYVELGIQTVERPFVPSIVETIVPYVDDKYTRITKFVKKAIFDAEDTDDSDEEDEKEKEKAKKDKDKKANENDKTKDPEKDKEKETDNNLTKSRKLSLTDDSSDSNIILSDQEESLDSSMSASLIVDMNIDSDLSESGDEFEREVKKRLHNKEKEKQKQAIGEIATTHAHVLHDELKNASFDKLCDLSIESVALIYTPFTTLLLWVFYNVNNLVPNYGIAEPDIIFYLLFAVVIIPFQLSNDVLHFNIAEFYHGEKIYEYLKSLVDRYKNRKTTWKGLDEDIDTDMEEISRRVDQFCFSSQYFFLMSIGTTGVFLMLLGGQTIISAAYNPFNDTAAYYTVVIFIVISVAMYYVTFYTGRFLRIWRIDIPDKSGDSSTMNAKSEETSISEEGDEEKIGMNNLVLRNITNWDNVDKAHAFKERLHEATKGLHSANFNDDQFKTNMIKANFYWFTSNVKEVFTPTTLKGKRKHIIQSFKQIYGELSPRVIGEENNNEVVETKFVDQREKKIIKKSLPHSFIAIIKLWKTRASLLRKIRSQVAGIIECSTGSRCEFCFTNQNLRAELVSNIEDIFIKFLKDHPTQNTVIWSVEKWQEVFKKNALIRTLCFECFTEILDHHIETSVQETINRRVNERRRRTKGLATNTSMSMMSGGGGDERGASKKMSWNMQTQQEESQGHSRLETKDFHRLETQESRILDVPREIEPSSATKASRDVKTEARIRLIENENVKNFLKGWLEMAKMRVKPPDTFR